MSKFKGFRQASSNILKAFGGAVTYQQITHGIYDDSEGAISETITEHSIVGFFENVKSVFYVIVGMVWLYFLFIHKG